EIERQNTASSQVSQGWATDAQEARRYLISCIYLVLVEPANPARVRCPRRVGRPRIVFEGWPKSWLPCAQPPRQQPQNTASSPIPHSWHTYCCVPPPPFVLTQRESNRLDHLSQSSKGLRNPFAHDRR